jgi:hypothetical protein
MTRRRGWADKKKDVLIELGLEGAQSGSIPRVATIAAMVALPLGSMVIVNTVGALWTYWPNGTLPVDGINVVDATGIGVGQWWRGPSLITTSALAQSTWNIDPQNTTGSASDENTGLDATHCLLSAAEVLRRWGTDFPKLTTAVCTMHWVSTGPTTDIVVAQAALGTLFLTGAQTAGAPMTLGTFAAKNKAAGTLATINVVGHGAWTPGTIIHDTTANAGFEIIADLGGGSASITQPLSLPISTLSTGVTLSGGDSLVVITQPTITAAVLGSHNNSGFCFIETMNLANAGGLCQVNNCFLFECTFAGLSFQALSGAANALPLGVGCYAHANGGSSGSGALVGKWTFYGGAIEGSGNNFSNGSSFDTDVALLLRNHFSGTINLGSVYLGQWFEYIGFNGAHIELVATQTGTTPLTLYGPASIVVNAGLELTIPVTTTADAALLCTGGVSLDGPAFSFNGTTGVFVGPTTVTPTNIDAGGGLQNPATGSRISFAG